MESRCKVFEEKYDRIKNFKKIMKSCLSMQCSNCSKNVQSHAFENHVEQCLGNSMVSVKDKGYHENKENIHISVSQTVVKES